MKRRKPTRASRKLYGNLARIAFLAGKKGQMVQFPHGIFEVSYHPTKGYRCVRKAV